MYKFDNKIQAIKAVREAGKVTFAACLMHVNNVQANPRDHMEADYWDGIRLFKAKELVEAIMDYGVQRHYEEWDAREEEANRRNALAHESLEIDQPS